MLQQSDIQGRLRLLRYGLLVVVVLTFFVVWLAPYAWATNYLGPADPDAQLGNFLGQAVIATVIAAVLAIVVYVVYHYLLTKSLPLVGGGGGE